MEVRAKLSLSVSLCLSLAVLIAGCTAPSPTSDTDLAQQEIVAGMGEEQSSSSGLEASDRTLLQGPYQDPYGWRGREKNRNQSNWRPQWPGSGRHHYPPVPRPRDKSSQKAGSDAAALAGLQEMDAITTLGPEQYTDGNMWVIYDGKKRAMTRKQAVHHGYFNFDCTPKENAFRAKFKEQLDKIPDGPPMGPPDSEINANCPAPGIPTQLSTGTGTSPSVSTQPSAHEGTLIRAKDHAPVYLVEEGKRRHVPDELTLHSRGWTSTKVTVLSSAEVDAIPLGSELPRQMLPDGFVVKAPDTETFIVEGGKKRMIPNEETAKARGIDLSRTITLHMSELGKIPTGEPLPAKASRPEEPEKRPQFPIQIREAKGWNSNQWFMDSTITIQESGDVELSTFIKTDSDVTGFTGAVYAVYFGEGDTVLGSTPTLAYSVAARGEETLSTWVPGQQRARSNKTEVWRGKVDPEILPHVRKVALVHVLAPKRPAFAGIQNLATQLASPEGKEMLSYAYAVAKVVATVYGVPLP